MTRELSEASSRVALVRLRDAYVCPPVQERLTEAHEGGALLLVELDELRVEVLQTVPQVASATTAVAPVQGVDLRLDALVRRLRQPRH